MWPFAVAHLLQSFTSHAFRDAILRSWVTWVTVALLLSGTTLPILWLLISTRHFCQHSRCSLDVLSHWVYSLLTLEKVVHGNPSRSAVSEILRPAHLAPWHVQSHLNPLYSPFWWWVWTSASCLDPIYMPQCIALQPCDWLISYLC